MTRDPSTESLMSHDVPPKHRRSRPWMNFGTKVPRCDGCNRQPPACICKEEKS